MDDDINAFSGQYRFLSNFYWENGSTVEHRFQASKTFDPQERALILRAATPALAKRLGGPHGIIKTLNPDWEELKLDVMERLVREKFENPVLRKMLLNTGHRMLRKGNHWGDTYWGVNHIDLKGENHLGLILMKVRSEL